MSYQLFIPRAMTFAAVTAGLSGVIVRWTYTVPAGRWAILTDVSVVVAANGNAANTTQGLIRCTIGGTLIRSISQDGSGSANSVSNERVCNTHLSAGDTVTGLTINNGAGAVSIIVDAVIKEYQ